MEVTLYGVGANRSARCRWVLEEAGVDETDFATGAGAVASGSAGEAGRRSLRAVNTMVLVPSRPTV